MGNYDSIQVPASNIPISSSLYGVPMRAAVVDLDARLSVVEANLVLPAPSFGMGNGINSVTAGAATWQALSPNGVAVSMTNPSTNFDLVVDVTFGAWMQSSTSDVRMGIQLSGGMTVAPGPGTNQPAGWGLFPATTLTTADQHMGYFQATIPKNTVSAVTFTAMGYRTSASSTAQVNYPTIYVVARRYQ